MKRKRNSNPLSHARGKQQRPENVWFRKEGEGYSLFVEYYAGQPSGVVADYKDTTAAMSSATNGIAKPEVTAQEVRGRGQSRASKRRKKRRSKIVTTSTNKNKCATSHQPPAKQQLPQISETSNVETREQHPLLQSYYRQLSLQQKTSSTLSSFVEALSRPLPLTFRLRLSANPMDLRDTLRRHHPEVTPLLFGDGNIYQATTLSKATISPSLKQLLRVHSEDGRLARQELGSMLPVLALQRGGYLSEKSRILDMCASPGSKTLQALELGCRSILANDVLASRLDALKDAVARSGIPMELTQRISYSCRDASQLSTTRQWSVILCDVPCSGDGTCRKDRHILPMWKPNHANRLHLTQVKLLVRAIQLLKKGGVVCYSTCSLNPIENEAVVAAALRRNKGVAELLEFPELTGFARRPGVHHWRVAEYTKDGELCWHKTYQDALDGNMDDKPQISMWPPQNSDDDNEDDDVWHLERCTRLWPQDHDSGGFFLALIKKTHC